MNSALHTDRLVDVVFPRPLPQAYTYRVPAEWQTSVAIGTRVRAPLGRSVEIGVVVAENRESKVDTADLRSLAGLIDPDTPIPSDVMQLGRWVSDYYLCTLGEALSPVCGTTGESAQWEIVGKQVTWNSGKRLPNLTPTERRIMEMVGRHSIVGESRLRQLRIGRPTLAKAIRRLTEVGLIATRWKPRLAPIPKEATILGVSTGREGDVPAALMDGLLRACQGRAGTQMIDLELRKSSQRTQIRELMRSEILDWEPVATVASRNGTTRAEPGRDDFDPGQKEVLARIETMLEANEFHTALLWGPTGSGKTAVYCAAIRRAWELGRTALLLVPEISLAGPMLERLRATLAEPIGVWHSGLTPPQRYWMARRVAQGRYRLVVGARSAIYAPIPNLGLIVVDEEHADAYKQSDPAPRYHARDVAVVRARLTRGVCLLGSATPSSESYHNATTGKYDLLRLTQRISGRAMPLVRLIDLTHRKLTTEDSWITPELRDSILTTVRSGKKVIIFLNRRGYATMVACNNCGHFDVCPDCGLTLTFHRADRTFRCHLCTYRSPARDRCPKCGGSDFLMKGIGTQKIEELLSELDPAIRLARLDADIAAKRGAAESILSAFSQGEVNVLLGTQMVAKGLDVPGVGLVGVIWADQQMAFPDFRAEERTFQLLTQVAGRAGRDTKTGEVAEVAVQTFRPDHDLIELAAAQNAELFFTRELPLRASLRYPPFTRLILLSFSSESAPAAYSAAHAFSGSWTAARGQRRYGLLLGPSPGTIPRRAGKHVVHILLKCDAVKPVRALISEFRQSHEAAFRKEGVGMVVDVDPVDFW